MRIVEILKIKETHCKNHEVCDIFNYLFLTIFNKMRQYQLSKQFTTNYNVKKLSFIYITKYLFINTKTNKIVNLVYLKIHFMHTCNK